MEQIYNYTNDDSRVETIFRNYATDIKSKADDLKTTASDQSGTEISTTRNNDIQGDSGRGSELKAKAEALKNKAGELNRVAGNLEEAAKQPNSPLKPLQGDATKLKDTAEQLASNVTALRDNTGSGTDYTRAQQVKSHYEKVVSEFNELTDKTKVKAEFDALKAVYEHIRIHYSRILKKAAGSTDSQGLRALAKELYAKATDIEDTGSGSSQGRRTGSSTYSSLTGDAKNLWHIKPPDKIEDSPKPEIVSPTLMVIVGIMKSQRIYDPYVWMGNWGGKHEADTATGDLTLTPTDFGNYSGAGTHTITLTINNAKYKTGTEAEKDLILNPSTNNTLVLTSGSDINNSNTHTITRKPSGLTLKLQTANNTFNNKTYNVSLNITTDISLGTGCSGCKLKTIAVPVSLGTYSISVSGTSYTGTPEDSTDYHGQHQSDNCCYFGNQNTWSTEPGMYSWHSPLYFICVMKYHLLLDFQSPQRVSLLHTAMSTFTYYILSYI